MGTVHGVYLKYVGLSALSYAGLTYLTKNLDGSKLSIWELLGYATKSLFVAGAMPAERALQGATNSTSMTLWRSLPALVLGYSTILNGLIAVLFKMEIGMGLIGKDRKTGRIPTWSYILFFPFHGPTFLYTYLHKLKDTRKVIDKENGDTVHKVPVATQVQPGWWVGGCYGHELDKDWAGVIDLTVEFPESTIHRTRSYLSLPTWDGVPATPAQLEQAANFAVQASESDGDVLVHCAHGRGRSTTIMCACLVKAGLFATWEEAFEQGIKPHRPVCKLNRRMRQNLTEWQDLYVDDRYKKGQ